MGLPKLWDGLNSYERQIRDKRPPGRIVGENRATHRARLRKERLLECVHCNKRGHTTAECWSTHAETPNVADERQPKAQP